MDATTIESEILDVWNRFVEKESFHDAERMDIKAELTQAENSSMVDAQQHLGLWLALVDEALHLLRLLHQFTFESLDNLDEKGAPAFLLLLSRVCALTNAVRRLVISGLEDAAETVARSLLETLDLALVALDDEDFAALYLGDEEGYDADSFWKAQVAWGKLDSRIKKIMLKLGFSDKAQEFFFASRKSAKRVLSASVHSSISSAMTSMFVPSLSSPGLLSASLLGHVSIHSPGLLSLAITEIYRFSSLALKLLMSDERPHIFSGEVSSKSTSSLLAAFLTYQELIERYDNNLPPPIVFPDVE